MARRKSWIEKRDGAKPPHVTVLAKAFAGVPAGKRLLISNPAEIESYLASIPAGQTRTVAEMREALARRHGADATCPTSTGIFLKIAAEAALEKIHGGTPPTKVAPFWRIVDPKSPLARKLTCGQDFLETQRAIEAR